MAKTSNIRLHLLSLSRETRRQILFECLMCEIENRQPYPFGRKSLPIDRHLHPVFPRTELVQLENRVWDRSSFWGKEPMTRLMRVSKQLYEEVGIAPDAKSSAIERIISIVQSLGKKDVKIFWEPNAELLEGKEIVDHCIERLGQDPITPKLHQDHLRSWPTERVYVTPALKDEEAETPPPSTEEFRSFFTRDWALKVRPKPEGSKPSSCILSPAYDY
ncbi:hypothetical protein BDV95DRAFT_611212 [Massariosphaeria phaeospora]|uniref:Uncharacterized protein n=1 Tax=Massariosphaeria phaeospora TaxID=100035 RepID=A0A7C8M3B4_9PLEO|nr:hypothetical protein BDV95DRAFT_611212 [Massariosphaeria phaeospora]